MAYIDVVHELVDVGAVKVERHKVEYTLVVTSGKPVLNRQHVDYCTRPMQTATHVHPLLSASGDGGRANEVLREGVGPLLVQDGSEARVDVGSTDVEAHVR